MTPTTRILLLLAGMAVASIPALGWTLRPRIGAPMAAAAVEAPPAAQAMPVPDAALEPLHRAFTAYDRIQDHLAHDQLAGIADDATAMADALTMARAALPAGHVAVAAVTGAVEQSQHLAKATTLEDARDHFANISRALVVIAESDQRLQAGHFIFRCPMTKGYKKWVQGTPTLANPYMGSAMSTCGTTSTWMAEDQPIHAPAIGATGGNDIAFFTCSMHPAVKAKTPGKCPICGMDLISVTTEQVASGEIMIDHVRRQLIGIRTSVITKQPMTIPIQSVGRVAYDETGYTDVNLKIGGWVTDLPANITGAPVQKGQPLVTLYSPELYAAEQEYALSLRPHPGEAASALGDGIRAATLDRLRLWDLTDAQISEVRMNGPQKTLTIMAPASGYLIEKNLVQGAAVMPGQRLFRIAPTECVWILAEIFETDLSTIRVGQPATVSFPNLPGATSTSTIDYLYPYLNDSTRSVRARLVMSNVDHRLKPDMYATVAIAVDAGVQLQVPKSAVIYTGPRRLVFVDLGEGRLRPRQVTLGRANDQNYEVLSGLKAGDTVVTSGNFLVAAESRIRSAEQYWGDDHDAK